MRNLSVISADAEQLSEMVHGALLRPFWAAARESDAGVWFDAAPWLGQPMLFWKEALKALCHRMGTGLVKESSIGELLLRLHRCVCAHRLAIPISLPAITVCMPTAPAPARARATVGCH